MLPESPHYSCYRRQQQQQLVLGSSCHQRCYSALLSLLNRGSRGGTTSIGGFANAKSFATVQTAMYYIAGSPQVYDSSNPQHTPGRVNYVGPPNDRKLCSTW
jgi:hypothetical protein